MLQSFCLSLCALALLSLPAWGQEKKALTPAEALKRLQAGNDRFATDKPTHKNRSTKRRIELAEKQRPIVAVLSCSDSRVVPAVVFDQGVGDVFNAAVAGNVAGTNEIASTEFAVAVLQAPLIVVLGHSNCGAVKTAIAGKEPPSPSLKKLVNAIGFKSKDANQAIRENVSHQAEQLLQQSKIIKDFVSSGRCMIVKGVYDVGTGKVKWLK